MCATNPSFAVQPPVPSIKMAYCRQELSSSQIPPTYAPPRRMFCPVESWTMAMIVTLASFPLIAASAGTSSLAIYSNTQ